MAKKKQERVAVPLDQLITQPRLWAKTIVASNETATVSSVRNIINTILSRFQGFWNMQKMAEHRGDPQLYMNFVSDDFVVKKKKESGYNPGDVVFKLHLSDLEDDNHYDRARAALNLLHRIDILVQDKEDPDYWRTQSFADIRGRTEEDPVTKERYFVGTDFEVIIPSLVAQDYLDISLHKGYIRLMSYPMFKLRSTVSNDLYVFLSEKWNMGHADDIIIVSITELRQRLGFVKTKSEDRSGMYPSWSKFCEKVLEPAKREMDTLAQSGGMSFTFTYEPLLYGQPLPPYKRPDSVRFILNRTECGKRLISKSDYNAQAIAAKTMMKEKFLLTDRQSRGFMKRVTPDMIDGLLQAMQQLLDDIQAGRRQANSIPATAYDEIDRYIRKHTPSIFTPAEEVKPEDSQSSTQPTEEVSEAAALAEFRERMASPAKEAALPDGWWRLTGLDKKGLWEVMEAVRPQVSEADFRHWVEPLATADTVDHTALIIRYIGSGYRHQEPLHSDAYRLMLSELRRRFPNRITDLQPTFEN